MTNSEFDLRKTLLRGAGVALCIQTVSLVAIYGSEILFARWMNLTQYGIYNYAIALSVSLSLLAGLGLPSATLKLVSEYRTQKKWTYLRGILQTSWQQTLVASFITVAIATGVLGWLSHTEQLNYGSSLLWGVWLIVPTALINLQREIIRGFNNITLAYSPSLIVYPLLLVGCAWVWQLHSALTGKVAIAITFGSMLLTLALQWWLFHRKLTTPIREAQPVLIKRQWWKIVLPLVLFDGSLVVLSHTDTLMIGAMLGAESVGIYTVVLKTSVWVQFILRSVNAISAPMIASLYARGERQRLQQLVSTIAQWMFYPALIVALALIVFATTVLRLFGSQFEAGRIALIILIVGQLVNVGAGSVGYLMIMTGHQLESAQVMAVSAGVNLVLNMVGIRWWGITGAAAATAISMALWNVWLYILVVKRLNVRPSIWAAWLNLR